MSQVWRPRRKNTLVGIWDEIIKTSFQRSDDFTDQILINYQSQVRNTWQVVLSGLCLDISITHYRNKADLTTEERPETKFSFKKWKQRICNDVWSSCSPHWASTKQISYLEKLNSHTSLSLTFIHFFLIITENSTFYWGWCQRSAQMGEELWSWGKRKIVLTFFQE